MVEDTVLSLSYGRIVIKPPEKLHGLVPESFETYQVVDPGDIIVRPTDLQNDWTTIRVAIARDRGIITSAYLCFHARKPLTPDYAHLLLLGYDMKKVFYGMGSGLRQNLDWSDFKRLPMLVPPAEEQQAIVRYVAWLDRQVRRFIRNRRRLIEVLNEQKQAIINRAVTRGLDSEVSLKSSGIDWLGDVPDHWRLVPIRWYLRTSSGDFLDGQHITGERSPAHPNPVIGGNGILGYTSKVNCSEPTIVIGRVGALCGNVHLVNESAWITDNALRLSHIRLFSLEYLSLLLKSMNLNRLANSNAQPLITGATIKSQIGVLPPDEEQRVIVKWLAIEMETFNEVINKAIREIELIREYRTRLISDVVTGKIDVRHLAPPPGSEDLEETFEAFEPLEDDIDDVEMDEEEEINESD
jgi:type I restriction enzyme S subunit